VSGAMDVADRDLILWKGLASEQKDIQSDLKKLGDLVSLTWAGRLDLNCKRLSISFLLLGRPRAPAVRFRQARQSGVDPVGSGRTQSPKRLTPSENGHEATPF